MKKFLSDSLFTTVAFTIQKPFAFVREFLLAIILGPYYMGLMNFIVMLKNYSMYSFIGTLVEMYRQVARDKENTQYLSTTMGFSIIVSIVIAFLVIIFVQFTNYSNEINLSLYLLTPLCLFFLTGNVITNYLLGLAKFKTTTVIETIFVILNTVITVSLAYYFGYLGAVCGLLIAVFIRFVLYYNEFRKLKIKIKFEIDKFIFLLKNGINLFINSISATIYNQVDSLIAILMLGPAALGIYGMAITINTLIYSIFGSTIAPLGQKMLKESEDENKIKKYLHAVTTLAGYVMIFPILLIVFVTPFLINNFLTQYTDVIVLVSILAPAAFFNVILGPISSYLIARNRERTITISTVIAIIINLVLNVYFIMIGYGLVGIALSTSVAYFVNFVLLHYLSKTVTLKQFLSELFPLFYMLIFLYNYLIGIVLLPIYIILTYYVFSRRGTNEYLKKIVKIVLNK